MYKLSLHIICTRSVIKFSVPGGKYRTDFRYFRYLFVDIRYFSVLWIPTSVSVSVFQNIGYRFGISVYRPKTSVHDVSLGESGVGSWGEGSNPAPHQLGGLGKRCELPQRGSGRSPDRPKVFHYFQHSGWPLLTL